MLTSSVRPAAVAGLFYPGRAGELRRMVEAMLAAADAPPPGDPVPKAVIAPHAGYVYSGPVAASAFRRLAPAAGRIRRVVVVGPAHRVALSGLALPGVEAFETPLGRVPVDPELAAQISGLPQVVEDPLPHREEHSLEVELPFLQVVLGELSLLPLVVGDASGAEVAGVLEAVWNGSGTAVVISSDLSHYLPYEVAREVDRETAGAILELAAPIPIRRACGARPIDGLLTAARRHRLEPALVDLRSSGDTAGDRGQVVGYGAFTFTEPRAHG